MARAGPLLFCGFLCRSPAPNWCKRRTCRIPAYTGPEVRPADLIRLSHSRPDAVFQPLAPVQVGVSVYVRPFRFAAKLATARSCRSPARGFRSAVRRSHPNRAGRHTPSRKSSRASRYKACDRNENPKGILPARSPQLLGRSKAHPCTPRKQQTSYLSPEMLDGRSSRFLWCWGEPCNLFATG